MLGQALKEIRTSKGVKQEELAEDLNVDQSTIARWEVTGRIPTPRHEEIADALEISVIDFYLKAKALTDPNADPTSEAPRPA